MSPRVSDLLAGLAPSATLAVDAKAKALKAAGEPVIGYGAGEPDFPTPAHIVEAAIKACQDPANYKYTPTAGLPLLREAIAAKTLRDSGLTIPASQILVTNGGKHAVATTSAELAEILLESIKVAVVPGEAFGTPGYFRLSYALGDDDLAEGLNRLHAFVANA